MKITSASKKVLASALSAAMVVAFAPTVAFAAPSVVEVTGTTAVEGTVASFQVAQANAVTGLNEIVTECYTIGQYGTAQAALNAAITDAGTASVTTVKLEQDATAMVTLPANMTLDLNGHTLSNSKDEFIIDANGVAAGEHATITAASGTTVKNGTVKASKAKKNINDPDGSASPVSSIYVADAGTASTLTLEGVTAGGVDTDTDGAQVTALTVKGGELGKVEAGTVSIYKTVTTAAIEGDTTVQSGAQLTAKAENSKTTGGNYDATAIDGTLAVLKGATVTAEAASKAGEATAINGDVTAKAKDAVVNATAKAIDAGKNATAIAGSVDTSDAAGFFEGATVNATAVSAGKAYGIVKSAGAVKMAAGTVSAEGANADSSFAISLSADDATGNGNIVLDGGSYTGKIVANELSALSYITAGKYSVDPSDYVDTNGDYDVSKVDGMFVVQQFKGFDIDAVGCNDAVANYVEAAAQEMVKGNTPAGIKLAEGVTPADFVDACKNEDVKVVVKSFDYVEKNATDEQKAAKTAIDEALKADLSKLETANTYKVVTVSIEYNKTGVFNPIVLGTITDLGQISSGMSTKQAMLEIPTGADETIRFVEAVIDGKAQKMPWKKDVDGKDTDVVEFASMPTLYAIAMIDQEAVKDAAEQKPETPSVEKATQSIDVAQKSKTVKLAKGKTKTQKAVSFKLGASAETALTIAKKSGSSRISVSGQKVTLKKGTKKGTFTAKVSLKAAGSDEFLAAAKTITVKFVVKK